MTILHQCFIDNDNELELLSRVNNNGWQRPYWVNGTLVHLSPKKSGKQIREWINRHSRFLYFVVTRLDKLRALTSDYTVVRARVGTIPILPFSCAGAAPYSEVFARVASHHGIEYWDDVADVVLKARQQGDVLSSDEHWNKYGHKLIALQLARHLRENPLFARSH